MFLASGDANTLELSEEEEAEDAGEDGDGAELSVGTGAAAGDSVADSSALVTTSESLKSAKAATSSLFSHKTPIG